MSVLCAYKQRRCSILQDENLFLLVQRQKLELHLHESVYIGTSIQKFLNDICVSALTSDEQRGSTIIHRRAVNDRARFQQNLCDVSETALRREKKCSRSSLGENKLMRNLML